MLNERGGVECDFTVTRLAQDSFQIVTGTAFGLHDRGWIFKPSELLSEGSRSGLPTDKEPAGGTRSAAEMVPASSEQGSGVRITDVTAAYTCLGLWGPRARDILSALTSADLSNEAAEISAEDTRSKLVLDSPSPLTSPVDSSDEKHC
jgi:glycine cleavage system aminomethyltransferase T